MIGEKKNNGTTKRELQSKIQDLEKRVKELEALNKESKIDNKSHSKTLKESEKKYQMLVETSTDGIVLLDLDNKYIFCNQRQADLLGYKNCSDLLGKNGLDFIAPEYIKSALESIRNLYEKKHIDGVVFELVRKDGSRLMADFSATVIFDDKGNPDSIMCLTRDITKQKKVENALKESEERFRTVMEQSPIGKQIYGPDGTLLYANKSWFEMWDVPDAQSILYKYNVLKDPQLKKLGVDTLLKKVFSGESVSFPETSYDPKDSNAPGRKRFIQPRVYAIKDKQGKVINVVITNEDVTKRKNAEESLSQEKSLSEDYLNSLPGLFYVFDKTTFIKWNEEWREVTGYSDEELGKMYGPDFVEGEDKILLAKRMREVFIRGYSDARVSLVTKEGKKIPYYFYGKRFKFKDKYHLIGLGIDITQLTEAEERLQDSEKLLRKIAENFPNSYLSIIEDDLTCGFSAGQEFKKQNLDPSQFKGLTVEQIFGKHAHEVTEYYKETFKGKECSFELFYNDQYQFYRTVPLYSNDGTIPRILTVVENITERIKNETEKATLEEQLRRSQKLETIGTLAGGIAHDFNNILTPILGYTDMAIHSLDKSDILYQDLKAIKNGGIRAKELVEQILTFSRQIEKERQPLQIQLIIKEVLKLLRPIIPVSIKIKTQIDTSCGKVFADPGQIHQIIMNLCTNSYQAMEETGGTLTLELKEVLVDRVTLKSNPNLKEKKYISLSVSDTGIGMDKTTIDRVFEPFFTTKTVNKGTGMGLSVVHGIVRSHNGDIIVDSKLDKGSTFQVFLPLFSQKHQSIQDKPEVFREGNESILIVDDEEIIAKMLTKMLTRLGYSVRSGKNGVEALKIFKKHADEIDLVISDLTMPDMSGLELSKKLHEVQKQLPVVLITGFSHKLTRDIQKQYDIFKVLSKPIIFEELAGTIREVFENKI